MKDENLSSFLRKHYGTLTDCAKELGVTQRTVQNWISTNPRGLLKHAPEIVAQKNITWTQLGGEVLYHEEKLQG